jgi:hypothetical protein
VLHVKSARLLSSDLEHQNSLSHAFLQALQLIDSMCLISVVLSPCQCRHLGLLSNVILPLSKTLCHDSLGQKSLNCIKNPKFIPKPTKQVIFQGCRSLIVSGGATLSLPNEL